MEAQTELEIFSELEEHFDEDKECEHTSHNDYPEYHEGKAAWYVQLACGNCKRKTYVTPVCDKWVRSVETGITICLGCKMPNKSTFVLKEKIK